MHIKFLKLFFVFKQNIIDEHDCEYTMNKFPMSNNLHELLVKLFR